MLQIYGPAPEAPGGLQIMAGWLSFGLHRGLLQPLLPPHLLMLFFPILFLFQFVSFLVREPASEVAGSRCNAYIVLRVMLLPGSIRL